MGRRGSEGVGGLGYQTRQMYCLSVSAAYGSALTEILHGGGSGHLGAFDVLLKGKKKEDGEEEEEERKIAHNAANSITVVHGKGPGCLGHAFSGGKGFSA